MEPQVAWQEWPAWQFDLLAGGLKEELEMDPDALEEGGSPTDPLARVSSAAPDWSEGDELLEGLED